MNTMLMVILVAFCVLFFRPRTKINNIQAVESMGAQFVGSLSHHKGQLIFCSLAPFFLLFLRFISLNKLNTNRCHPRRGDLSTLQFVGFLSSSQECLGLGFRFFGSPCACVFFRKLLIKEKTPPIVS